MSGSTAPIRKPVAIRKLREDDLPGLEWDGELEHFRGIFTQAYQQYISGEAILWVASHPEVGIVAQLFVQLSSRRVDMADGRRRAYIYGFRVRPEFRNQGLGTRMMAVVEDDLRKRGYRRVTLNVGQDNEGALRLYERLGYQVIAPDPGKWSYTNHLGENVDVDEPAWRMEKLLDQERSAG